MIYLLAKFALIILLATALGIALGYWWSRRHFVDVSESYEDLRRATERDDSARWSELWSRFDSLPKPQTVELEPMATTLEALRRRIERMPVPLPVDLQPVAHKMDAIEKRLDSLPQPEKADMTPIYSRLLKIENDIERIRQQVSKPAIGSGAERGTAGTEPKRSEPQILSAALYGEKDDLKKISGVGPKLERLLNDNGVFYFWQVASWSRRDIDVIDERLDAFRGRIFRDDWVSQAKRLRESPDAAAMPAHT